MRRVSTAVRTFIEWLGWTGVILLILTLVGLVGWWNWDRGRQIPLPPQAQQTSTELLAGLAKRTTFLAPGASTEDVRAFYREVLPQRDWSYCGTQATPGCTNLINLVGGSGDQIDVYRQTEDRDYTGTTIEVWATENARGETQVVIWETTPSGGS